MFGRFDEVISRLVSFFITPILNIAILSFMLTFMLAGQNKLATLFPQIDAGGLLAYVLNMVKLIFSGDYNIEGVIRGSSQALVNLSSSLLLIVLLAFLIVIFLIDRTIYYLGWFVPFDFAFDLAAYGREHAGDRRVRQLYEVLGVDLDFRDAYGVVATYLGNRSSDPVRMKSRDGMIKSVNAAAATFCYLEAYLVILVAMFVYSIATGFFDLAWVALGLALTLFFGFCCAVWYSRSYQELIAHDIDSFVWLRCYDESAARFAPLAERAAPFLHTAHASGFVDRLLSPLYLTYSPSGIGYGLRLMLSPIRQPAKEKDGAGE